MTIEEYTEHVESLFDNDSEKLINNGQVEHAAVLLSTMFRKAQKEVVVFCRNLRSAIYDRPEVVSSITGALKRGIRIRILTQEKPEAIELLLRVHLLNQLFPERKLFQIKQCKPTSPTAKVDFNFAVMDEKAFRYEPDRQDVKAFACANDPVLAKDMLGRFNPAFSYDEETVDTTYQLGLVH